MKSKRTGTDRDMGVAADLTGRPPRNRNQGWEPISHSFNFWLVLTPRMLKSGKFLITTRFCLPRLLWDGSGLSGTCYVGCGALSHRACGGLRSNDVIGAPGSTR